MKTIYGIGAAVVLCFGALTSSLTAQENTNPNEQERDFSKIGAGLGNFLNIPVGARAVGIGGGFVGVADDPTTLYWNPAGMMQVQGASAAYGFASMFAGITHNYAGVTFPVGDAYKAGVSALAYGTDEIGVTTMFQQDGTGETYTVSDLALGVSFAGQLTEQFAFGVTGKFINLSFATNSANGVAFDVGTLYEPGILGMRLGFAVQNLSAPMQYEGSGLVQTGGFDPITGNQNPDVQFEATEASLPLTFRGGISSEVMNGEGGNYLMVATEFSTASDRGEFLSLGAEYTWNDLVSARAGYQLGTSEAYGLSGGVGLKYQTGSFYGQLDYGIRPHKTLGLVNLITASVRFQ